MPVAHMPIANVTTVSSWILSSGWNGQFRCIDMDSSTTRCDARRTPVGLLYRVTPVRLFPGISSMEDTRSLVQGMFILSYSLPHIIAVVTSHKEYYIWDTDKLCLLWESVNKTCNALLLLRIVGHSRLSRGRLE